MELNSDFVGQTREKELNLALEEINWYHTKNIWVK